MLEVLGMLVGARSARHGLGDLHSALQVAWVDQQRGVQWHSLGAQALLSNHRRCACVFEPLGPQTVNEMDSSTMALGYFFTTEYRQQGLSQGTSGYSG